MERRCLKLFSSSSLFSISFPSSSMPSFPQKSRKPDVSSNVSLVSILVSSARRRGGSQWMIHRLGRVAGLNRKQRISINHRGFLITLQLCLVLRFPPPGNSVGKHSLFAPLVPIRFSSRQRCVHLKLRHAKILQTIPPPSISARFSSSSSSSSFSPFVGFKHRVTDCKYAARGEGGEEGCEETRKRGIEVCRGCKRRRW